MSMIVPPIPAADEFAGKVALVTGGTNGLGWHLSKTLIGLGADVFFCGRQVDKGEALIKEWGPRAHFMPVDLANVEQTRQFVNKAGEFKGRIDYVVNNAAIDPPSAFETTSIEDFDKVVAINLRAFFVVTQTAMPYLKNGEGKAVVNIGSTNYIFGHGGMTVYNSAKSGIVGFTRSLAREIGEHGIRVNIVCPGWIGTERQYNERGFAKAEKSLVAGQCVKYPLTEQHVTPATLFFLSQASAGISGQQLVVDGGKAMY